MNNVEPEGWSWQLIGEVFDISIGGTPSRNNSAYWDIEKVTNNRWLSIRDLRGRTIKDTSEYLSDEGVAKSNAKLVPKGTVIMSFKLTVGRTAFTGIDLYTNEAIVAFFPKKNVQVNLNYFYQGLQFWDLLENIDQAVKGVTLNKEKLNLINGLFPPLSEQQKIAKILTSVDEVIEKTQAQIDKLKDLKTGMMQELLTSGIGHTEFKDSPVGRIPAEWKVLKVSNIANVVDSMHLTPSFCEIGKPMVRVTEIRNSEILDIVSALNVDESTFASFSRNYRPTIGDTLIARVGAYFGATAYIANSLEFCLGQNTASIRPESINSEYLFIYLNSEVVRGQMDDAVAVGAQPSLSLKAIKELKIALPPKAEQEKISNAIFSVSRKIELTKNSLDVIKKSKKALMQDLLTGKVRVKVDSR